MTRYGYIGLGMMGSAMAENLILEALRAAMPTVYTSKDPARSPHDL